LQRVIAANGIEEAELLRLSAAVESSSEHPLARAIVDGARSRDLRLAEVDDFDSDPGLGVWGTIDDRKVLIGNLRLMQKHDVTVDELTEQAEAERENGATAIYVAVDNAPAGLLIIADAIKDSTQAAIDALRNDGVRVIMLTGDNVRTAEAVGKKLGVSEVLADVLPQDKADIVKRLQDEGQVVAMAGDGVNDAPALAQADVGVAMNTGTQAAREAGNMVDLDSDPTKLIEVVEIGKQLLMTRGALTTFSIANDVAKYFAIIPAMFVAFYPQLQALNLMQLATPESAILSAIIFNALIIIALIPLALRGVAYRPVGAAALLRRNLLIYGLGGLVVPFIGIKAIDLAITGIGLA
jgi:K+-transporting ATPase ATPase B chain